MAVYNIGKFIKEKRERLGINQDELCEGICSPATISRIEAGGRIPKSKVIVPLLQRLGLSDFIVDSMSTKEELEGMELITKMRSSYVNGNMEAAKTAFAEVKPHYEDLPINGRQFCRLFETILKVDSGELDYSQALPIYEDIMRMTVPGYSIDRLPRLMSFEEINVLNNIAIAYGKTGGMDTAIAIYYAIKQFYDRHSTNIDNVLRTLPMIYYNLSKYLGLSGRYDECVRICEEGINYIRLSGRYGRYSYILYNLAWVLLRRKNMGDLERADFVLKTAYCSALMTEGKTGLVQDIQTMYRNNYNRVLPDLF